MLWSLARTMALSPARCDLVVLVTPEIGAQARRKLAAAAPGRRVLVREVNPIPNPHSHVCHVEGWVNAGFTKLHVWDLDEYETVVYVDADALVLECVDELFERPIGGRGAFAAAPDVFPPDKFNAGVLVVKPCSETFSKLCKCAPELPSHDGGDTGFLNAAFPKWFTRPEANRLPFGYNAQRTLHWLTAKRNPGYWAAVRPLKIVHYSSSPKPWEDAQRQGELEARWWAAYAEAAPEADGLGALLARLGALAADGCDGAGAGVAGSAE